MRKALALVLALAMTLALAACGSSAPEAPANTPAPENAAPSAADDAAPAPSEDAGKTIKIGVSTDTATTVFRKVELMGVAGLERGQALSMEPANLERHKREQH